MKTNKVFVASIVLVIAFTLFILWRISWEKRNRQIPHDIPVEIKAVEFNFPRNGGKK